MRNLCIASLQIGAWIVGIALISNVAEEANRMLRCENGERVIESWGVGIDGRMHNNGTVCYKHALGDRLERWTTNEDGEPVQLPNE